MRTAKPAAAPASLSNDLLAWYDHHARDLPWRVRPIQGQQQPADPYRVWLSEVMLQQTVVASVRNYYETFLSLWPRVEDLAAADFADIARAWAGLGYYARARNLHKCAQEVTRLGGFPKDMAGLQALPGIGPYTAAAIGAIAFGLPTNVVDGNVERVMARLYAVDTPLPDAKPALIGLAAKTVPDQRPGDYAQSLMDLGATICTPRAPKCGICPVAPHCASQGQEQAALRPYRKPKPIKPQREGAVFVLVRGGDEIWTITRPASGLLGGMKGLPSGDWTPLAAGATHSRDIHSVLSDTGLAHLPVAEWRHCGQIGHVFTHFALTLDVYTQSWSASHLLPNAGQWLTPDASAKYGMPSVFEKAVRMVRASRAT